MSTRFFRAFPILLSLALPASGVAVSVGMAAPNEQGAVAAVFPPWWPASRVFVAASNAGEVLNSGPFFFVVLVQSQRPGLSDRLRTEGALLLLNPLAAGGCEPSSRNQNV